MNNKVNQIKEWANENYELYGASVLVECFSDEDLDSKFMSLSAAKDFANLLTEQNENYA